MTIVLRSLAYNLTFYLSTIVLMIFGLPALLFGRRGVFFIAQLWGDWSVFTLRYICGLKVEYRGLENIPEGGYIVAAKHQSFLETFALLRYTPDFAIILKKSLTYIPLFGLYLIVSRQIAINRAAGQSALTQIVAQAGQVLRDGRQVYIYPEGTRRPPGAPPAYKSGVAALYCRQPGALPAGRAQYRAVLGEARLHPPAGRRRDRISAADRARSRKGGIRAAFAGHG